MEVFGGSDDGGDFYGQDYDSQYSSGENADDQEFYGDSKLTYDGMVIIRDWNALKKPKNEGEAWDLIISCRDMILEADFRPYPRHASVPKTEIDRATKVLEAIQSYIKRYPKPSRSDMHFGWTMGRLYKFILPVIKLDGQKKALYKLYKLAKSVLDQVIFYHENSAIHFATDDERIQMIKYGRLEVFSIC